MKILNKDIKKGFAKILIDSKTDLWYLSHIIDPNDKIKSKTERKIKLSGEGEKAKVIKKIITLELSAEKIELQEETLKILGKITHGPDDIPIGSFHSFNLRTGSEFTINKEKWLKYQLDKLENAEKDKGESILITLFDREEVLYAKTQNNKLTILSKEIGDVEKKGVEEKKRKFL
jgi:protein pelota